MDGSAKKLIVITGPTASGKSLFSVELARLFGGEIVNADSMQVYREMDVGTAKSSLEARQGIPHHLIDIVNPDEPFNAAIYRSLAVPIIEDILARGRVCFLVGGTGLYIKTLLGGLLFCPPMDPMIREELQNQCDERGSEALHRSLVHLDSEAGQKIHPKDRVRIIRALEIMRVTGRSLSALTREHRFKNNAFRSLKICLQIEREDLYHRINERSLAMVEKGLVEETERLLSRGYSPELNAMKSLGYRHAVQYLKGLMGLDQMVGQLQRDTRRYAKRQVTWFRADPEMKWITPQAKEILVDEIHAFIRR